MLPAGTDSLWQLAERRWAEIAGILPDLEPALVIQKRLLRITIDALEQLEVSGADLPDIPSDAVLDKWVRGVPAFRNETIPVPARLKEIFPALCRALVEGGAGDSARHIGDALASGDIDAASLLSVSLARNEKAIRTNALHMGFSPDLVWLIGELGSSPMAHHLQARLLGRPGMQDAARDWDRGYCLCCGSWPVFVEFLGGQRLLRCSFCAAAWQLTSHRCIYCRNSGKDFLVAASETQQSDQRVELCRACGGYTKIIEVRSPTPFPLLAIEDLATVDLDQGAMSRDYVRPKLFDLDSLAPRSSGCA